VSSLLHHVHVTGIPYGTPIYYKCACVAPSGTAVHGMQMLRTALLTADLQRKSCIIK
jgi:hypothetical protein